MTNNISQATINIDLDIAKHLKLWYRFEETKDPIVKDLSGNDFHGSYKNNPNWSIGLTGESFKMEGNHPSYVLIPNGVLKDVSSITIASRVRWTSSSRANEWIYGLGVDIKKCLFTTPKSHGGKLYTVIKNEEGSFSNQDTSREQGVSAPWSLPINQWHYIVLTIDTTAKTSVLYVDGVKVESNHNITIKPSDLYDESKDYSGYIGKSLHWDPGFTGEIDDFRIYSAALDEQEVASLTYEGMTDDQIVAAAFKDLHLGDTTIMINDLTLPDELYGSIITYQSTNPNHLHHDGRITRPSKDAAAVDVDLIATITRNAVSCSKFFSITILPIGTATHHIEIDTSQKGVDINSKLFGLFFEDINYSLDGGLYAELVQNGSFECLKSEDDAMVQSYAGLYGWNIVATGDGVVTITTASSQCIHPNNPHYLEMVTSSPGTGVGVYNTGYPDTPDTAKTPIPGMYIVKDEKYDFSMFVRSADYSGTIEVSITNEDGTEVYASALLDGVTEEWKKIRCVLQASQSSTTARLQILMKEVGVLNIDMVSLFPQKTWKGRKNGVRCDLGEMLGEMKPKFFRFPGGCLVEGRVISNRFQWKETVGPLEHRKSIFNNWAHNVNYPYYNQSHGFGFYDYFQLSEDLQAEPIPCINGGISHPAKGTFIPTTIPMEEMGELVQDAIDLIEFANGTDMSNPWAKLRCDMGHPEPFNMKYLEIGNENGGDEYYERYQLFAKAIRVKYPEIKLIVGGGFGMNDGINQETWSRIQKGTIDADIVDDHYYIGPEIFYDNMNQYDNYNRSLGTVFVGEYASWGNSLKNALSESAYMSHLEENGDVVELAAYAPLFAKRNYTQWGTNAIFFDNTSAYGTVNYYIQKLFMQNKGDITLPSEIIKRGNLSHRIQGAIGLETHNTAVEFADVLVIDNNTMEILFKDDFTLDGSALNSSTLDGSKWSTISGSWKMKNGRLLQPDIDNSKAIVYGGNINCEDYTLTLKAKKTAGSNGFLIHIGRKDSKNYYRFNLGGWGNSKSAFEKMVGGRLVNMTPYYDTAKCPSIMESQWYEIQLVVTGNKVKCCVDGVLIFDIIDRVKVGPVYTVASKEVESRDIIVKVTNPQSIEQIIDINLNHLSYVNPQGEKTVLKGDSLSDSNTFETPSKIIPITTRIDEVTANHKVTLDPYSFTIFRFHTK